LYACLSRIPPFSSSFSLFTKVLSPNLVDWGIEDPKGKSIEKVREIRDEIEQRVKGLTANLVRDSNQYISHPN
ncbi:MAG: hypothetical protein WA421_10340, partial [Nitrososphaeraceae archaeon]